MWLSFQPGFSRAERMQRLGPFQNIVWVGIGLRGIDYHGMHCAGALRQGDCAMTEKIDGQLERLLETHSIVSMQDGWTEEWHREQPDGTFSDNFAGVVQAQHYANFELWHLEDEARTPGAADREIAEVKRGVDRVNQRRNDLMERCDGLLLESLQARALPKADASLHSETPGMILDRLSILALKIFHTRAEVQREDVPEGHGERNRERLRLLEEQRSDLAGCLDDLWKKVLSGERRFKLYRQLKMYNDPSLNPAVYKKMVR
ncbi:MAG: DUF4254 domain-containing protein [Acidobacteriaceae bacterium]